MWDDVRHRLSEPRRVRAEYERQLQGKKEGTSLEVAQVNKLINNVKRLISRLIYAYGDGLLDKSEFEPRIATARELPARLEAACRQRVGEATQEAGLGLAIGQLEQCGGRVSDGGRWPGRAGNGRKCRCVHGAALASSGAGAGRRGGRGAPGRLLRG